MRNWTWTILWGLAAAAMLVICIVCGAARLLDGATLAAALALACAWQAGAAVGKGRTP